MPSFEFLPARLITSGTFPSNDNSNIVFCPLLIGVFKKTSKIVSSLRVLTKELFCFKLKTFRYPCPLSESLEKPFSLKLSENLTFLSELFFSRIDMSLSG